MLGIWGLLALVGICTFYVPFFLVGLPAIEDQRHSIPANGRVILLNEHSIFQVVECERDRDILSVIQNNWLNDGNISNKQIIQGFGSDTYTTLPNTKSLLAVCNCRVRLDTRNNEVFIFRNIDRNYNHKCPKSSLDSTEREDPTVNVLIWLIGGLFGLLIVAPYIFLGVLAYRLCEWFSKAFEKCQRSKQVSVVVSDKV